MKQYLKCLIIVTLVAVGVTSASVPQMKPTEAPETAVKSETVTSSSVTEIVPELAPVESVAVTPPAPTGRVPYGVHDLGGSGDCAAEVAKYDWNVTVATAVARAESGLRPGMVNNTPSTGDYSVGCFQVNLYGANARNRPSQDTLIIASENVKWAYNNYVANGHSFLGQWGVCRSKVSCY